MDFGHPGRSFSPGSSTSADVKMSGAAAFGMLYLPVPVVSVYAKAGLARLQATSNVSLFLPGVGTCPINNPNCAWFSQRSSATNTSLAPGAGRSAGARSQLIEDAGHSPANPPAAPASTALTKPIPFGVPRPVTSSQPRAAASELSVPKVMTYQRVDVPL